MRLELELELDDVKLTSETKKLPKFTSLINDVRELRFPKLHETDLHMNHGVNFLLLPSSSNADGDGDALVSIGSTTLNEGKGKLLKDKILLNNEYKDLMAVHTHESLYALMRISKKVYTYYSNAENSANHANHANLTSTELTDNFIVDIEALGEEPYKWVKFKGVEQPLLYAVLNRIQDNFVDYNKIPKITKKTWNDFYFSIKDNNNYLDTVWKIDMFLHVLSSTVTDCGLPFTLKDFVFPDKIKYTVKNEAVLGIISQDIYVDECLAELKSHEYQSMFMKMIDAGVGLKASGLAPAFSTGYSTLFDGSTTLSNTTSGLVHGISDVEYALTASGSRKGLELKEKGIPLSGGKMRAGYNNFGIVWQDYHTHDCGTTRTIKRYITKDNIHRYHGSNYVDENNQIHKIDYVAIENGAEFKFDKYYNLRSPIGCKLKNFAICRTCWHEPDENEFIKYIGIESISKSIESIIQGMLSSHHTSGAFYKSYNPKLKELVKKLRPYEYKPNFIRFASDNVSAEDIANFTNLWHNEYDDKNDLIVYDRGNDGLEFIVKNTPLADDSTKVFNAIMSIIDKNVTIDSKDWVSPDEALEFLYQHVDTDRYLKFLELILSSLYFDEFGYLSRESGRDPVVKVAISSLLLNVDPSSSLLHGYSKTGLANIQCKRDGIPLKKDDRENNEVIPTSPYIGVIHHAYDNLFKLTTSEFMHEKQ